MASATALDHTHWWKDPGLRQLNFFLVGLMLGSAGLGYDASLVNGLLSNDRWFKDLNVSNTTLQGLVISAQAFGAISSLIPAAYVSDLLGRRPTNLIANVAIIAAIIGQNFSKNAVDFLGTRLIIGFFTVWVIVASTTLVSELSHPRHRAVLTAMCNTFFYVGGIVAAWTSFGALPISSSWSWRLPVILQLFFPVAQSIFIPLLPESPRWLMTKGRGEEAKAILAKYHANGAMDDELVVLEYNEISNLLEAEEHNASYSWFSLFANSGNVKRTLLTLGLGLSSQWVGNGIISYYLSPVLASVGITSSRSQLAINGGLQVFNWVMALPAALLAERVGRKRLLLISASGMLVFITLVTVCSAIYATNGNLAAGRGVIAFIFLFFGCYDAGYTPIPPLYISEIASTHLRAKYTSLYWMSTAVALCFNQYVNPIAFSAITWKYYFVYIGVLIVTIVCLFLFAPETKGQTLEEVAAIFEGDGADIGGQAGDNGEELKNQSIAEHKENV